MVMQVIPVAKRIARASTFEDGATIYNAIKNALGNSEIVEVSFEGITSVPSSFINGSFVQLLEDIGFSAIKQKIKITHSTRQINLMIKSRLEFVEQNKILKN